MCVSFFIDLIFSGLSIYYVLLFKIECKSLTVSLCLSFDPRTWFLSSKLNLIWRLCLSSSSRTWFFSLIVSLSSTQVIINPVKPSSSFRFFWEDRVQILCIGFSSSYWLWAFYYWPCNMKYALLILWVVDSL